MPYQYIKREPAVVIQPNGQAEPRHKSKKKVRWAAAAILAVGLFLIGNAVFPLVYYQLVVSPKFALKPGESFAFAQESTDQSYNLASSIELIDYTKLSNWISGIDQIPSQSETVSYKLSIPKLGIRNAIVNVGGNDLKKSLIQYPGTSLPGKPGNPIIFGHSTLPQLSRTTDYKSIFSFLPTKLTEGDALWVDIDGVTYKYFVERMVEMGPNDLSILAQRYDDSYLTLVTCVPPGTYMKRLVVRARITKTD